MLGAWSGPFGLPPFAAIKPEHFPPAFEQAPGGHRAEVEAIAGRPGGARFRQHHRGDGAQRRALLTRVSNIFFVLAGADTSDALQEIERDISPLLARHNNEIYLNERAVRAGSTTSTGGARRSG